MHTLRIPEAVDGPSAWYGDQMRQDSSWLCQLSPTDVAELRAAVEIAIRQGTDLAGLGQSEFVLPGLAPKLFQIREQVINGRGFALLRGVPVQEWSVLESSVAFLGLGSYFGNARSQNGKGHLLGHVCDLGRDAENDPTARIYQTSERQTFHTDSCDIVSLLCLKTAKSGGASALVSSATIFNEMLRRRPDLLPVLFGPMQTDRRGEVPEGENPWHEVPVFSWHQGFLSTLYARRYIESARRFDQVPPLTPIQIEALDLFDQLANDPVIGMQMVFKPGDVQLVHNHTMLHDRTAFEDWPDLAMRRHLLRLWLAAPNARPLPPVYAQRFGSVEIGNRGGIVVPGMKLTVPMEPV